MKRVRISGRSALRPVVLAMCLATASGTAMADDYRVQEGTGMLSGLVAGALVGGPPGAIVGAIGGGLLGHSFGRQQELEQQTAQVQQLRHELQQAQARNAAHVRGLQEPVVVASAAPVEAFGAAPHVRLDASVQFRSASAELEPHFAEQLHSLGRLAAQFPRVRVQLRGYADRRGPVADNLTLSRARVAAVRQALIATGVDAARIDAEALGENEPLYGADDGEGRDFERRVWIHIETEEPRS